MLMMIYVDVYMIVLGMPDVRQPTVQYLLNLFSRAPYRQINRKSKYILCSLFAHSEISSFIQIGLYARVTSPSWTTAPSHKQVCAKQS